MSNETQVHEIDGIGEFRARAGTAVGELAGAAKYWSDRAKRAERINANMWGKGFTMGVALVVLIDGALTLAHHFHIWF